VDLIDIMLESETDVDAEQFNFLDVSEGAGCRTGG